MYYEAGLTGSHFSFLVQKPKESCGCVLHAMRQYLLKRLVAFIPTEGHPLAESAVIPASALIRLYAALKGLATLKCVTLGSPRVYD